ncbi:MAG: transposase [Candidatus Berkiella sp.]
MSRPPRIEFDGAWHHVMNRGAAHQAIFKSNKQRELFLELVYEASKRFEIELHGFCLMDNHYHLLIHTPQSQLHKAMKHINGCYTLAFNYLEKRDGPLLRGRYKSLLIDDDSYLLQVSRYIHLNPVEALVCEKPIDYPWSSYKYYVGSVPRPPWLHTYMLLGMLDKISYEDFCGAT